MAAIEYVIAWVLEGKEKLPADIGAVVANSPAVIAQKATVAGNGNGGLFFTGVIPLTQANGKYVLGLKFAVNESGKINKICYYQAKDESGAHVFRIWNENGEKLKEINAPALTGEGWQIVDMQESVSVEKGQTYTISYVCNSAYVATPGIFGSPMKCGALTGLAGVYEAADFEKVPAKIYNNLNYFIDVDFKLN